MFTITLTNFSLSRAKLVRGSEAYRIPKNYYPFKQLITLTYYSQDLKIEGETTIYVNSVDKHNFHQIIIHAYNLNISGLEITLVV